MPLLFIFELFRRISIVFLLLIIMTEPASLSEKQNCLVEKKRFSDDDSGFTGRILLLHLPNSSHSSATTCLLAEKFSFCRLQLDPGRNFCQQLDEEADIVPLSDLTILLVDNVERRHAPPMSACPYVAYQRSANRLQIVLGGKANLAYASVIIDSRLGFVDFQLQMVEDQIRDLDMALQMALMIVGQSNDFVLPSLMAGSRYSKDANKDVHKAMVEIRDRKERGKTPIWPLVVFFTLPTLIVAFLIAGCLTKHEVDQITICLNTQHEWGISAHIRPQQMEQQSSIRTAQNRKVKKNTAASEQKKSPPRPIR